MVSPVNTHLYRKHFSDHNFFGFEKEKVSVVLYYSLLLLQIYNSLKSSYALCKCIHMECFFLLMQPALFYGSNHLLFDIIYDLNT